MFRSIVRNIVLFNYFNGILKQKHITKTVYSINFHYLDKFLHTILEVLIIVLCIYIAGCQILDSFQIQICKSDWLTLINKVKHDYLNVFKVNSISIIVNKQVKAVVTTVLIALRRVKKSIRAIFKA